MVSRRIWGYRAANRLIYTGYLSFCRCSSFVHLVFTPINDTVPVAVADLISEYHGEWIKFPYDLETIARRFIYMYQIQYQTPKIYTVLPIDTLQGTQVKDGFLKISTIRRRVSLDMSRTTASDFYASVNLGLCFCRSETEPPHLQRTLLGPILPQRVIIVRKYGLNKVYYLMKSPERRSRITK